LLGAEPGQFREVTTNRTYVIDVDVSWLLQSKLQNVTALTKHADTGERMLQDILAAAAKGSNVAIGGENEEGEPDALLNEGWVDNIGQGRKDEDNLSLYIQFSEGEEKSEDVGANKWSIDGFNDITTNGNKMKVLNEEIFTTESTTSNVNEGEPGKVRPLYDLVFRRDVMENEEAGMFVTIPRGSSLEVGMFHTSHHDSHQRATLEFWDHQPLS